MDEDNLWQLKLHARLHDPAEKALVLLRDPAGHEGGTSRALHRLLGLEPLTGERLENDAPDSLHSVLFQWGLTRADYETVRRADWWAAAADRPQWPMEEIQVKTREGQTKTLQVAPWARVHWARRPVLIHPLTGAQYDLGQSGGLADTDFKDIKARSLAHFTHLIARQGDAVAWRQTLLAFWRFGPELQEEADNGRLGALWRLLPADTRVPDHSIWDHLDLASAFAGAFAGDPAGEAALLALSIGPVQSFIAAARSTSDLWAGSHLLSRLAWEAMRPVCEALGPDAVLFPRLRGVPQVDLWLRDQCRLDPDLFGDAEWARGATDGNPLYSAALPNRFVAVVPRSRAVALAHEIEQAVRTWLDNLGRQTVERLLEAAGLATGTDQVCHAQMREQLAGFPEVHWAVVPFSLIRPRNAERQTDLDTSALSAAMAPFFGAPADQACGFLDTPAWRVLSRETTWDDRTRFFAPNPGVLYPAIHDLAERVLAAAKTTRQFGQSAQSGWRCSLTGETEWLTTDRAQLALAPGQRQDTLWTRIADQRLAWAKRGEHLGALPAIKRLWPTLFAEEVGAATGEEAQRFVVSTHTMALAHQLDRWLETGAPEVTGLTALLDRHRPQAVALPRGLLRRHGANRAALAKAKRLAGLLETAVDLDDDQAAMIRDLVAQTLAGGDRARLETYYALMLMDGDRMGQWLVGSDDFAISYSESFHPEVRAGFESHARDNAALRAYGQHRRAVSPNRHLAISGALNDFALTLVRHVIEREYLGRVIYAGGDDVLAMLPVADLLPAMQRLRNAYSGTAGERGQENGSTLRLDRGFALLDGRLMRTMGERATASAGAVIAHHQAPLSAVLRELRAAEQRAKDEGGRDAFSLTLVKRSGGIRRFTAKWGEPVALLAAMRSFLADPDVSRRAVYNSLEWLKDLPPPAGDGAMLEKLLSHQLARQTGRKATRDHHDVPGLCHRLTQLALSQAASAQDWLANFLAVAEFLAREGRAGTQTGGRKPI